MNSADIQQIVFRQPVSQDGPAVSALVAECPPLDLNSSYCYLLLCSQFASTCVVAEIERNIVGFLSSYLRPDEPDTLFVWQIAVAKQARGEGLGKALLNQLLTRPATKFVNALETTITASNRNSLKLFESFAKEHNVGVTQQPLFDRDIHFAGQHETEICFRLSSFALGSHQLTTA